MSLNRLLLSIVFICTCYFGVNANDFKGFNDNELFSLNFPGFEKLLDIPTDGESIIVTSHAKEKYQCHIPKLAVKDENEDPEAPGIGALELLEPLFTGDVCSYRIESYWTYEVCHGNYIKQYHEERDGKNTKMQEYYLGKWTKKMTEDLRKKLQSNKEEKLKYKKIDGLNLPYFEVEMIDGTLCDLTNHPRVTRVLYVCYSHGKNEVYSLKETSSCNYEIVVLTPNLCLNPKYKIQEITENVVNCVPLDNAPKKPKSLLAMEVESMKLRYQKLMDVNKGLKEAIAVFKVDSKDGKLTMELVEDVSGQNIEDLFGKTDEGLKKFPSLSSIKDDTTPVENFLAGGNCLIGGTGWWKYEFCYGKYVRQFHVDKLGSKTSILLGVFDEKIHKQFLIDHPEKRPKPIGQRKQIIHFYNYGSTCDKTGKQRQVEVVLKCLENAPSASTVSLYLLEPNVCSYILGIESQLICDILDKVDDDGLVPKTESVETENAFIDEIRFQND